MTLKVLGVILAAVTVGAFQMKQRSNVPQPSPGMANLPAGVVGEYYFGDGLGVNCALKLTEGDFKFTWNGCMGEYDRNTGAARMKDGWVVLFPEKQNVQEGFRGTATRFYPVKWAQRTYLVSEDKMLGFCAKYQGGWRGDEFMGRSSSYYISRDAPGMFKDLKNLKGQPRVPVEYRRYLTTPFAAKVTATGKSFKIDKGSEDGVAAQTFLHDRSNWYRVTKVGKRESTCIPWGEKKSPKIGAKLTPVDF